MGKLGIGCVCLDRTWWVTSIGDLPEQGIEPKSLASPELAGGLPLAPSGKPYINKLKDIAKLCTNEDDSATY